jgi:hypothetical protein
MRAGNLAGPLKKNSYAMAKKTAKRKGAAPSKASIKRTITRTGEARYYQGGKRETTKKGAEKYVKQELQRSAPGPLTREEQKLFNRFQAAQKVAPKIAAQAASRLRFGGKFVKNTIKKFLIDQNLFGPTSNTELKKEFPNAKNYGDLLKALKELTPKSAILQEGEYGLINAKRNRTTYESTVDVAEQFEKNPLFKALTLVLIVPEKDGTQKVYTGKINALSALKDWETKKVEEFQRQGAAYLSFAHFGKIDIEADTITINLAESVVDPQYSA